MQSDDQTQRVLQQGCLPVWCRRCAGILLVLLVGLLAPFAFRHVQAWGTSSGSPRLELSATELDLGDGAPNEVVRGVLQLRNSGSAPLTFSIERSCGCTELQPREGTIPGGGQVEIALGVTLHGHANSERDVNLTVASNDPEQPVAHCHVHAKCPAPFEVEPAFIVLGNVSREEAASRTAEVQVTLHDGEQRHLRVRMESASFSASIERPGLVRVKPAADLEFGDHYGTLELFLEGAEKQLIRVPVHLQIPRPLATVPSTIMLRKDSAGGFQNVSWIVISDGAAAPLGDVTAVNAPPEFRIEELDRIDDRRRRYRLIIKPSWNAPERFMLELKDSTTANRCTVRLLSPEHEKASDVNDLGKS